MPISAAFPFYKKKKRCLGSDIAYVDEGGGKPVLFLHGNPTSSYLWRNILPYLVEDFRVIAPDLIGMGDSDKPDLHYSFETHARYLDELLEAFELKDLTIVGHDWGSVLGMRYARLRPDIVTSIALMEPIMPPALPADSYDEMGERAGPMFKALQTHSLGERLIYEENFFVETVLGKIGVLREMGDVDLAAYRRPFMTRQARKPTLDWPREMPVAGNAPQTAQVILDNGQWFYGSEIPKLLFWAEPGALFPPSAVEHATERATNLEVVPLGEGTHFLQEDHPDKIGASLANWLRRLT